MGFLLGYDIGTSAVKVSLIDTDGKLIASATSPAENELTISSPHTGWAEQHPELWWKHTVEVTHILHNKVGAKLNNVKAIGLSYQMHGLVLLDKKSNVLRPSIIWCDSRTNIIGIRAANSIGHKKCYEHLYNLPGNFTASKLAWVRAYERTVFEKTHKFMFPGDYIAYKLTGELNTTIPGLSEGMFWDYKTCGLAKFIFNYYNIPLDYVPPVVPVFGRQGTVSITAAKMMGIPAGIPLTYRGGDQPNNALSLNVLNPGEIAATAGTSGVICGVNKNIRYDPKSRVNIFAHVNYTAEHPNYCALLCVNGTGVLNSWLRNELFNVSNNKFGYNEMNTIAATVPPGAGGVITIPFGNGAERTLENLTTGTYFTGINFNLHTKAHIIRSAQEGIVYALYNGIGLMHEMGINVKKVRAGYANMFLSPVFRETFATMTNSTVELYNTDGAQGAARGAGIGAGIYSSFKDAFTGLKRILVVEPNPKNRAVLMATYYNWKKVLSRIITK